MAGFLDIAQGAQAGVSSVMGIGNPIIEGINYRKRSEQAQQRQKDLMGIQFKNQMALNKQGADLSYQNWLRTNYSAQLAEMKKAGLSAGLMYGNNGGQGGTTAGSGGSASGGSSPQGNMSGMPLDVGLQLAELELMRKQGKNLDSDSSVKDEDRLLKRQQTLTEAVRRDLELLKTKLTEDQRKEVQSRVALNNKSLKKIEAEIGEIGASTGLKEAQRNVEIQKLDIGDQQLKNMRESVKLMQNQSADYIANASLRDQQRLTEYEKTGLTNAMRRIEEKLADTGENLRETGLFGFIRDAIAIFAGDGVNPEKYDDAVLMDLAEWIKKDGAKHTPQQVIKKVFDILNGKRDAGREGRYLENLPPE
jgi:hypothetical protein